MKNNQKNWMKNLELLSLTSRSIEKCQPKRKTQNEEIIKLNKKIIITETFENLTLRPISIYLNIPTDLRTIVEAGLLANKNNYLKWTSQNLKKGFYNIKIIKTAFLKSRSVTNLQDPKKFY